MRVKPEEPNGVKHTQLVAQLAFAAWKNLVILAGSGAICSQFLQSQSSSCHHGAPARSYFSGDCHTFPTLSGVKRDGAKHLIIGIPFRCFPGKVSFPGQLSVHRFSCEVSRCHRVRGKQLHRSADRNVVLQYVASVNTD